ncbi:MAG: bifunctional 4-hydroxy-2-oxoglutarate aldolase/2-dehydro-3-deoxy-phosphogluconate aldolase [Planctomycetes bacterium]|nr:bifunctional 4-hydroxy-2-oxoglutarate aldolase/2-dehydro-3-deoxy-phosphogluconate aldolase [Planctomycetota bacterium]MBI3834521.1 bifunctional 4-hydroxy-2-oxoglutarate aldolase/2-dehydro-3-deoxy-phosphogluconate aldolase [Planctomycetota bacterium]
MTRMRICSQIEKNKVSAIIRTNDQDLARGAMQAAYQGGFRMLEFTLTTPGTLDLIREFSQLHGVLVGAGTVMTREAATNAVRNGAKFLVSPITDPQIISAAHDHEVPCILGAFTPTEMETAHRLGADLVKVFPAPPGGAAYLQAILAPLPHLKLFPTAGATPDNFREFLDAGCVGVGFVRSLFVPEELAVSNFASIRRRAEGIIEKLEQWQNRVQQTSL